MNAWYEIVMRSHWNRKVGPEISSPYFGGIQSSCEWIHVISNFKDSFSENSSAEPDQRLWFIKVGPFRALLDIR